MSLRRIAESLGSSDDQERFSAALELGREGDASSGILLVEALRKEEKPLVVSAICAGLELLADPSVTAPLIDWLRQCPPDHVWNVTHTLGLLTDLAPLVPRGATPEELRTIWVKAAEERRAPSVQQTHSSETQSSDSHLHFNLDSGRGRIRVDFDPPPEGTRTWARWNRSLFVDGRPLYSMGSTCGTCETWLGIKSWPKARIFEVAAELDRSLQTPATLDGAWLKQWTPLLEELQTGHYVATNIALPVTRADGQDSWFAKRLAYREDEDEDDWPSEAIPMSTGNAHFSGPTTEGPPRTFWVVMPSQNLETSDEERVAHYVAAIERGERPTPLALAWLEDRYVEARWDERFIILVLLDGHHKMQAYAKTGVPANILTLFHLDQSWGPAENPFAHVQQSIDAL